MGTIQHHAVLATTWDEKYVDSLREWMAEGHVDGGEILFQQEPKVNGYITVVLLPDGSKERWKASDDGDERRSALKEYLSNSHWDYVEVSWGELGLMVGT